MSRTAMIAEVFAVWSRGGLDVVEAADWLLTRNASSSVRAVAAAGFCAAVELVVVGARALHLRG